MRASETAVASAGSSFPFFTILALIFITLKLTGYIAWPWIWVLAPIWGPIVLVLGVLLMIGTIFGAVWLIAKAFDRR